MKTASRQNIVFGVKVLALLTAICFSDATAYAFQEHGPPEGMYIHQLAHICFALSMAGLWYGIRSSRFRNESSWKLISLGAALLVLWNVMTFSGHILWHFAIAPAPEAAPVYILIFWKFLKLDNIVCVSAMICFYLGLRKMLRVIHTQHQSGQHAA